MTDDIGILYAFIATLGGCLISVSAGLIAAMRGKAVVLNPPQVSPKPEHVRVPRQVFYGGGEGKPLLSRRWRDAQVQVSLMYFKENLAAVPKKPTGWINLGMAIPKKSNLSNRQFSVCPCA